MMKYHLLSEQDFRGTTMFVGTAWGNIYQCPCGALNVVDHHAPIRLCHGFNCVKCGCLLAFREGDIECVTDAAEANEEMIAFPTKVRANNEHHPDCRWEKTTTKECEYRNTHHYCPHPEHACDCAKKG